MNNPILYRKRIIPQECILLKDDRILSCSEEHIITSWNALHPKKDLHHGWSCYFLKEGFKVSKFCKEDGTLMYWYCDIVRYDFNEDHSCLTVTDLLADVLVYPDGFVKVADLNELADAALCSLLSEAELCSVLHHTDDLLRAIYNGSFQDLQAVIKDLYYDATAKSHASGSDQY